MTMNSEYHHYDKKKLNYSSTQTIFLKKEKDIEDKFSC